MNVFIQTSFLFLLVRDHKSFHRQYVCIILILIYSTNFILTKSMDSVSQEHMLFYFPMRGSRPQNLCLSPIEKSHIPVCLLCVSHWLRSVLVGHAVTEPTTRLQVHFTTVCGVCARWRHVPSITETI